MEELQTVARETEEENEVEDIVKHVILEFTYLEEPERLHSRWINAGRWRGD